MKIVDLRWYPYRLPLRAGFTTAHSVLTVREGAIVEIHTDENMIGIGEIAPLPAFRGASLSLALAPLTDLKAALYGQGIEFALSLLSDESEVARLPASTIAGLESTLLDALGQHRQCLISTMLAADCPAARPPRPAIPVNAVVGSPTIKAAVSCAVEAVSAGFSCIKLKLGNHTEEAIERVAAIREAIGPGIHLRLDANEAWNFEQAVTILNRCEHFSIQYVEQPLPAHDLTGARRLRQETPIPIAADEALYDLSSCRRLLVSLAADIFIIKPQLAGGLRMGQQIIREAAAHDVQCVVTSSLESGIGLVGALHLAAASPEISLECGLATLHLLEDDLLVEDLFIHNGFMSVPTRPGLGVQLDRVALARYAFSG